MKKSVTVAYYDSSKISSDSVIRVQSASVECSITRERFEYSRTVSSKTQLEDFIGGLTFQALKGNKRRL